jgi:hypothetical protein
VWFLLHFDTDNCLLKKFHYRYLTTLSINIFLYLRNVRSIKKKIELPGLCYSDALTGSNQHFRLF